MLLKGALDIVSDGERVRFNKTGNAGMTVGGTGDVLAGICAGLLAKGMDPFMAARVAAYHERGGWRPGLRDAQLWSSGNRYGR